MTTLKDYLTGLAADSSPDGGADYLLIYDAADDVLKKITPDDLGSGGGGSVVAARYQTAAAQSLVNNTITIVDFGTSDYDTDAAVTTGASWNFEAPSSGYYNVETLVAFDHFNTTVTVFELLLYVNGALKAYLDYQDHGSSGGNSVYPSVHGSMTLHLAASDTLDIRVRQSSGGSKVLLNDATFNWVSITRIGA